MLPKFPDFPFILLIFGWVCYWYWAYRDAVARDIDFPGFWAIGSVFVPIMLFYIFAVRTETDLNRPKSLSEIIAASGAGAVLGWLLVSMVYSPILWNGVEAIIGSLVVVSVLFVIVFTYLRSGVPNFVPTNS